MVRRFAALGLATLLALSACGGDDSGGSSSETTKGSSTEASSKSTDGGKATTTEPSGGGGSAALSSAKNCKQLVEAATPIFTQLFQGLVDDVQGLSVAELAQLQNPESSDLFKQWTDEVQAETKAIDDKVDDLNCSEEDGNKAVCDAVAAIKADNPIAEAMVKGMAGEC